MCFSERSPRRIKAEFLQQPELAMIGKLLSAEMAEEKTRDLVKQCQSRNMQGTGVQSRHGPTTMLQ